MKRTAPPFHLFASAGSSSASPLMSSRTSFRGDRGRGRGRRSYSDSSVGHVGDCPPQFVTGDSHFWQVQDANRGFRPSYNGGNFSHSQSSPNFTPRTNYYNPRPRPPPFSKPHGPPPRPLPFQRQPNDQNQQPFGQPSPRYGLNQQFRPQWQHQQQQVQQFKRRLPKDLIYRNWEYAKPEPPLECERFTVLSYNVLADYLATDHWQKLYSHIPRYMMDWERRKRSIIFELGLWSADILCFQEVDRFQDLKEQLELRGYSGIWKMRTGNPVDGCAIFWRNSRFKLLREESIEFNTLGLRDNVAQICVFESLYQYDDSDTAAPAQSLKKANKVVVCNIHVLFNPKRGEIKLGQVRVLLSQAHTISKFWDDAPVVVCGDFNSTPKSPLYNFISQQKLDLSELPRDQVSGQASAGINPLRPSSPEHGAQSAGSFTQVLPAASIISTENCGSPLFAQKQDYAVESSGNRTCGAITLSESFSPLEKEVVDSWITMKYENEEVDKQLRENDLGVFNGCNGENESAIDASHNDFKETPSSLVDEAESSGTPFKDVIHDSCVLNVKMESLSLNDIVEDSKEGEDKTTFLSEMRHTPSSLVDEAESSGTPVKDVIHDSCVLNVKMESLCLNDFVEDSKEGEDKTTFLSEMRHTGVTIPSQFSQSPKSNSEVVESFKECAGLDRQGLHPPGSEMPNNITDVDPGNIHVEQSKYDPSAWTPGEIEAASGSSDCIVMEHPLKLRSVYGEVEDCYGTRDSTGEPSFTSYHKRFFGTVDYIWHSEGLQTSRVLAPIPKHAIRWTQGFPTKKWGSDHIALVSELAFGNDNSCPSTEVKLQDIV